MLIWSLLTVHCDKWSPTQTLFVLPCHINRVSSLLRRCCTVSLCSDVNTPPLQTVIGEGRLLFLTSMREHLPKLKHQDHLVCIYFIYDIFLQFQATESQLSSDWDTPMSWLFWVRYRSCAFRADISLCPTKTSKCLLKPVISNLSNIFPTLFVTIKYISPTFPYSVEIPYCWIQNSANQQI